MVARGPSTQQIVRVFATVAALCAFVYLLYLVRSVIGLVAIATFLAMALGPAVDLLDRRWFPRAAAIVAVYLVIAAGILGIGTLFVPPVVSGVKSLSENAPAYIAKLRKNKEFRKYDNQFKITAKVNAEAAKLPQQLSRSAGALGSVTVGVFTTIAQLITVLTIAFFLLLDGERLFRVALRTFRPNRHAALEEMAAQIYKSVAGYVIGNLAISVIAGSVALATLLILGVPFAAPLAVLMAFFDLIPLVGATVGAIVIGLVTLFTDFPTATIVWVVVQLIYQQLESSVLVPVVYRRTVNVSGLLTIVAVLIGAKLLGILGALVAIPVAGAVQIVTQQVWSSRHNPGGVLAPGADEGSTASTGTSAVVSTTIDDFS
jgi:predicted PurR-regulated permease PerM